MHPRLIQDSRLNGAGLGKAEHGVGGLLLPLTTGGGIEPMATPGQRQPKVQIREIRPDGPGEPISLLRPSL
jgi:hypothetical protein